MDFRTALDRLAYEATRHLGGHTCNIVPVERSPNFSGVEQRAHMMCNVPVVFFLRPKLVMDQGNSPGIETLVPVMHFRMADLKWRPRIADRLEICTGTAVPIGRGSEHPQSPRNIAAEDPSDPKIEKALVIL